MTLKTAVKAAIVLRGLAVAFCILFVRVLYGKEDVLPKIEADRSYVVIASRETAQAEGWKRVVDALRSKYDASLILYPAGSVDTVLEPLRKLHPRFAAFVARPVEAGRSFVVDVHRLTRKLDEDPYTDLRWGIVTGHEPADALRIAERREPLIIATAASSMGPGCFDRLQGGFASSETDPSKFWSKSNDGEIIEETVAPDSTRALARAFNSTPPDLFITSGHATEHSWDVGFNIPGGQFRHEKGQLYALSVDGERNDINSPQTKVYMPMGNCLIGHIPGRDCMATAWIHSGGVYQMFGYTAVTFHGYMGWGIGSLFSDQYTLAEAFHFNNQSLISELHDLHPDKASVAFHSYDQSDIGTLMKEHSIKDRKLFGHLWDRDVVAFYGDPAWQARHSIDDPAWRATYEREGEQVTVAVNVLKDGRWGNRPLAIPFPERLGGVRGMVCSHDLKPVLTDDFALLPLMGRDRVAGETVKLVFGAHGLDAVATSRTSPPIDAAAVGDGGVAGEVRFDPRSLGLPPNRLRRLVMALRAAGGNGLELVKAIQSADEPDRQDVVFLVENMPLRDLRQLSADYLLRNVRLAQQAWREAPWKEQVSRDLYLEYVLPYATLTEKREDWRPFLSEKSKALVVDCTSPGEAAVKLNRTLFSTLGVQYHARKRPRPDQGPLESVEAGYASCTGLSILLINACRAVGIPARVAGVAEWTDGPGNHTWVEIWDNGWHCLGASESKALNKVWFGKTAAKVDTTDPLKRVYATRFSRGTTRFPIAWNPYAEYVPAEDVSASYQTQFGGSGRSTGKDPANPR